MASLAWAATRWITEANSLLLQVFANNVLITDVHLKFVGVLRLKTHCGYLVFVALWWSVWWHRGHQIIRPEARSICHFSSDNGALVSDFVLRFSLANLALWNAFDFLTEGLGSEASASDRCYQFTFSKKATIPEACSLSSSSAENLYSWTTICSGSLTSVEMSVA